MEKDNILKSAGIIGILTFLSRCFGMIRDIMIYNYLGGTSMIVSAFYIAFTIPNLFRRLFGEGALSASFIPVFIETKNKLGDDTAWELSRKIATLMFITLTVISIVGVTIFLILSNSNIVTEKWLLTFNLSSIMFPYIIFICLTALSMGILNSFGHFAIPAFSPTLLNIILILCMLIFFPYQKDDEICAQILAYSVITAGIFQLLIQLPVLFKKGAKFKFSNPYHDPKVKRILLLMAPIALGAAVTQFNVIIDKLLAMGVGSWAPAALTFSERLIYLPLGIFATALGTVLLPTFSNHAEKLNFQKISDTLYKSLCHIFYIMIPATIGLFLLSEPIINTLFEWRDQRISMNSNSIQHISRALICYSPGLIVFSVAKIIIPIFYSIKDSRTPVKIGINVVIINLSLNILSIIILPEYWKHAGMAASTVVAEGIGIYLLAKNLSGKIPKISNQKLFKKFISILWRSAIMGFIVLLSYSIFLEMELLHNKLNEIFSLLLSIAIGIIIYLMISFNLPEQQAAFNAFFKSKKRRINNN